METISSVISFRHTTPATFQALALALALAACSLLYDYKIATLIYKVLTFNQPPYLSHMVTTYTPASILHL